MAGYYSKVIDLDGEPAEGMVQWNYCEAFEAGRYSRYYSDYYGDQTITDTNFIENITWHPEQDNGILRFEMKTSQVCDTDSSAMFKFITHVECDENKTGPIRAKKYVDEDSEATTPTLDQVWYKEPCEYHVKFAHKAGCPADAEASEPVLLA